jgi:small subunit ribosomal protein S19e
MRSFYGGKKNRGSKPNAFRKGSGSILRKSLQQLEAAGFIVHDKTGRKVSPAGMAFLDRMAHEVKLNPPAPVQKRVKATAEPEPKKAEGKKSESKKEKAEKPASAKGEKTEKTEKKPAAKKAETKKPEKPEVPQ